jgi:hypothetical protein
MLRHRRHDVDGQFVGFGQMDGNKPYPCFHQGGDSCNIASRRSSLATISTRI